MNLNKCFIVGRLTADPVIKSTTGGQSVCNFSLATNRVWTDKSGAKQEQGEFHNCVAWGKTAELISQYMTKGCELLVEGRLQTRTWQDKQGQNRKTTEIVVESMQFGARPAGAMGARQEDTRPPLGKFSGPQQEEIPSVQVDEETPINPDDLPF